MRMAPRQHALLVVVVVRVLMPMVVRVIGMLLVRMRMMIAVGVDTVIVAGVVCGRRSRRHFGTGSERMQRMKKSASLHP